MDTMTFRRHDRGAPHASASPNRPRRAGPPRAPSPRGVAGMRALAVVCAVLALVAVPSPGSTSTGLAGASVPAFPVGAPLTPADVWSWPTGGPVPVVRAFDPPEQRWLAGHRGVDLDVAIGTEVRAPADGTVVAAGRVVDRGVVSVQHASVRSTFEPVDPLVIPGQRVARGQVLATVTAGHSPGALHWGARLARGSYVDPLRMLVGEIVLKPWG